MPIDTLSLLVAVIALLVSIIPILSTKKNENILKIQKIKKILLDSNWSNEGDITSITNTYFFLRLSDYPGYDKICGSLTVGGIEKDFIIYGKIKANDVILGTLNTTIGWRESPVFKIKLKYDISTEQIIFIPLSRLQKINEDAIYDQGLFEQKLTKKTLMWREPKIDS